MGMHRGPRLIFLVLTSLFLFAACGPEDTPPAEESREPSAANRGRPPAVATAESETRSRIIQVGGRLEPERRLVHSAGSDGLVQDLAYKVGDRVGAGEVLFTVDRNEAGQNFKPVPELARIEGIVSAVARDPGEEVREGDPVVTLIGIGGYRLEAKVSDKDAFSIRVGQAVEAHGVEGTLVRGLLESRSPEPDYDTGLFSLRFRFPAAEGLFVGAFLLIDLPAETVEGIFVPATAVDRRYGKSYLWLVDSNEQVLVRREVTTGDAMGDSLLITAGLEAGEEYLTTLSGREREGAPVAGRGGR